MGAGWLCTAAAHEETTTRPKRDLMRLRRVHAQRPRICSKMILHMTAPGFSVQNLLTGKTLATGGHRQLSSRPTSNTTRIYSPTADSALESTTSNDTYLTSPSSPSLLSPPPSFRPKKNPPRQPIHPFSFPLGLFKKEKHHLFKDFACMYFYYRVRQGLYRNFVCCLFFVFFFVFRGMSMSGSRSGSGKWEWEWEWEWGVGRGKWEVGSGSGSETDGGDCVCV